MGKWNLHDGLLIVVFDASGVLIFASYGEER